MSLVDNVVFLRHIERGKRVERLVSVMKMREGPNDASVREYTIGKQGFVVTPGPKVRPARSTVGPARAAKKPVRSKRQTRKAR
jgi:KaiC/GvpD/RAD55 family RecA-like ATPase